MYIVFLGPGDPLGVYCTRGRQMERIREGAPRYMIRTRKGTESGDNITHVTDADFQDEVLSSDVPVLVDFWAEWCGPCKMIAPVLEEIASEYGDQLKVCKVDVDANPDLPGKFGIRGIPTLIVFKGGSAVETKVGALSKTQLAEFVDSCL
jgi:thioredoxin 1